MLQVETVMHKQYLPIMLRQRWTCLHILLPESSAHNHSITVFTNLVIEVGIAGIAKVAGR